MGRRKLSGFEVIDSVAPVDVTDGGILVAVEGENLAAILGFLVPVKRFSLSLGRFVAGSRPTTAGTGFKLCLVEVVGGVMAGPTIGLEAGAFGIDGLSLMSTSFGL